MRGPNLNRTEHHKSCFQRNTVEIKKIDTSLGRTVCALGLEYGLCRHYSEIQASLKSRIRTEQRSISESGMPCDEDEICSNRLSKNSLKDFPPANHKVTPRFYFYLAFQPRRSREDTGTGRPILAAKGLMGIIPRWRLFSVDF